MYSANGRVSLEEVHIALIHASFKDAEAVERLSDHERRAYIAQHFPESEYTTDNWHKREIPVGQLMSANTEFRCQIFFNKNEKYVLQWDSISKQFPAINFEKEWLIPKEVFQKGEYIPIIVREYSPNSFWVWDGQNRTLSVLCHGLPNITAYVSPFIGS